MNIGIVVDNEFIHDERVRREADVLAAQRGYKVFVLCFDFGRKQDFHVEGINIETIKIPKKRKDILYLLINISSAYEKLWSKRIRNFIIKNKIDVIHTHDLYMSKASRAGIDLSGKKIPLILDLHENYPEVIISYSWTKGFLRRSLSRPYSWRKKEEKYLSLADKIIVLSESFKDYFLDKYKFLKRENLYVFPNVPDLEKLKKYAVNESLIDFDYQSPVFFYFGVIAERRGIITTLEAFKEVIRRKYSSTLLLVGPVDKSDKKLFFQSISDPEIKNFVIYKPWIDISELPTYLKISDIYLAPFVKNAHHESGISNKIYQYLFGKKPIIASDCKPQQDLIEKHKCGLIFKNKEELIQAMITLIEDKSLRAKMGENGYRALENYYNLKYFQDNLLDLYNNLMCNFDNKI